MTRRRPRAIIKPLLLTLLAAAVSAAAVLFLLPRKGASPQLATTTPTTAPSTAPTPTTKPPPPYIPKTLFDIVKHERPQAATTQPFPIPLDLRDAAHYTLDGPLYFDRNRLDLWITRPTAPPTPTVLRAAVDEQTHVVRDHVLYVHWQPDDSANWFPHLIVSTPAGPHLVYPSGHRLPLPDHPYDFSHPLSFNDRLAIPTPTGVVILHIQNNQLTAHPHTLPGLSPSQEGGHATPSTNPQSAIRNPRSNIQLLLDYRGLLAFLPSTHSTQGSRGVSRYLDGQWTDLTPPNFPDRILHLLPLLDGTVLVLSPTSRTKVDLHLLPLDSAPNVDVAAVTKLVESLSDDNEQARQSAFDQLTRYGPSIFPTLEQLSADQPPEARIRLQQLLRTKLKPTLGPASLIDNELRLLARYPDGSALFYSAAGISLPTPDDTPNIVSPAWIICRPGHPVRLLPDSLTADLHPATADLLPLQNEWISLNSPNGPSRYLGNELVPLLKPHERHFTHPVGIDRRNRWIFTTPSPSPSLSSAPHPPTSPSPHLFLLIDPTLPDPTPRLPYWALEVTNDATVGWDQHNNPALKSGKAAYALVGSDWKPLDFKTDTFTSTPPTFPTNLDRVLAHTRRAATMSTTSPTTQLGTGNRELGTPLLITPDGTRYFSARTQIDILTPSNKHLVFPLPPEHTATMDPTLLFADNHLFLFNQPGKCLRLTPTPGAKEPLSIDATFTSNIPNTDQPLRIWLDPAGRICHAPDDKHLILFFPTGRIPPEIAQKMPADQLDAQRD